jgi:hypothetical protein
MEAVLRAQAFEKAKTESGSHVSFEDWKRLHGSAGERTKRAKELAEAQRDDVLLGDVKKQKIAQAALSKSEASKSDKDS